MKVEDIFWTTEEEDKVLKIREECMFLEMMKGDRLPEEVVHTFLLTEDGLVPLLHLKEINSNNETKCE